MHLHMNIDGEQLSMLDLLQQEQTAWRYALHEHLASMLEAQGAAAAEGSGQLAGEALHAQDAIGLQAAKHY